jgi:histidine ammonia-lyase
MKAGPDETSVIFDRSGGSVEAVCAIARDGATVSIDTAAIAGIDAAYVCLLRHAGSGEAIYGVSTGLGAAVDTRVDPSENAGQHRIPRARAVGVGRFAETEEVRAMMATRIARFCLGYSGVSSPIVLSLGDMLNHRIHPRVPMTGSIGEADLAPLAHIALVLTGEGAVLSSQGDIISGAEAFAAADLSLPSFGIKDGLSLISSNAASVGIACLLLQDARHVLDAHLGAVALSFEGFRASIDPLNPLADRLRPGPCQGEAAAAILALLEGGNLMAARAARRLQDPLSLRCAPAISGTAMHALKAAYAATELELRSSDDNPAVIADEDVVLPTGNFDPTHMVLAFDTLGLSLARLAAMSAERMMKLLSPGFSDLPRFLAPDEPGANGFGALQKTIAALTAEIGHLAMPMPFAVTPVADRVEDYASMAMSVIDKTARLIEKLRYLTAIELIVAARAVDLRAGIVLGHGTKSLFENVRTLVPPLVTDRSSSADIYALSDAIRTAALLSPQFSTDSRPSS